MSINDLVNEMENRLYADGTVDDIMVIQTTDTIQRIGSVVIVVLAWLVIILLPIVVAIEIIYICFPVIREKTNDMILKLEQRGHKHTIPGFILRDAIKAIEVAEKDFAKGNGDMTGTSSALWTYLKIKIPAIFFAFFIITFALLGTSTVVKFISNLFKGFFGKVL